MDDLYNAVKCIGQILVFLKINITIWLRPDWIGSFVLVVGPEQLVSSFYTVNWYVNGNWYDAQGRIIRAYPQMKFNATV